MAGELALVNAAGQRLVAGGLAQKYVGRSALDSARRFAAWTLAHRLGGARRTRARVAEQRAIVRAGRCVILA